MVTPLNLSVAARRGLRRNRILDSLSAPTSNESERRYRDLLLAPISIAAAASLAATSELIDASVSVALSRVDESSGDTLAVLATTSEILARNGQLARLAALSWRIDAVGSRYVVERPFLSLTLAALAAAFRGDVTDMQRAISRGLGLGQTEPELHEAADRTWVHIGDIALANALYWFALDGSTERVAEVARESLERGDATHYQVARLIEAYMTYARQASLDNVVPQEAPEFLDQRLQRYLSQKSIRTLFPSQLRALENGALAPGNRIVAMPTSSGKTLIAELNLVRRLGHQGRRAVYLAPYRLLARQIERSLRDGLRAAGLSVRDLGGDFDAALEEQLAGLPDVAVMTPERMDAIVRVATANVRGSDEASTLLRSVDTIVFDEFHLVGRPGRGPRLEMFIARLRQELPQAEVLGLSAAVAGAASLAEWLSGREISGGERPTGSIELLWTTDGRILQRFDDVPRYVTKVDREPTAIDSAARLALQLREELAPILIVETTRPHAESVVQKIANRAPEASERWRENRSSLELRRLQVAAEEARATLGAHAILADLLEVGLAYHHAGVPGNLLRLIESLVRDRLIRVLGATTTVAEGADLPFRVVLIPHLNFQGSSRRLERDMYLNIVGRAGRANVAAEGITVVLDSDSQLLRGWVTEFLWRGEEGIAVGGQLLGVFEGARTLENRAELREIQSQVLAWLGERGHASSESQANDIATETLTWMTVPSAGRDRLVGYLEATLRHLDDLGFVRADSPYTLTEIGARARLAGVGPRSCLRLYERVRTDESSFAQLMEHLLLEETISAADSQQIASLVLEAEEAFVETLWFRRLPGTEREKVSFLAGLGTGRHEWPYESALYTADEELLAQWLLGASFEELGAIPPVFPRGIFSTEDSAKRASDAADYFSRMTYPASWAWGAAIAMLGAEGESAPAWVRRAIEWGVPSELAVDLIDQHGLSRRGAVLAATHLSPAFPIEAQIAEWTERDMAAYGLTTADVNRLLQP